jgi:hypothetical protein
MAIRNARIALVILGVALLGLGGIVLLQEVNPKRYVGILAWFVGALIIHDGIIAPIVFLVTVVLRTRLQRVPTVVVAIIQGALVVGGIVTLVVVPEIMKKSIGTLSTSILPQDYALHLVGFYVVLAVLTVAAILGYRAMFTRRQKLLSSSDQA